jgi:hypothetical protein
MTQAQLFEITAGVGTKQYRRAVAEKKIAKYNDLSSKINRELTSFIKNLPSTTTSVGSKPDILKTSIMLMTMQNLMFGEELTLSTSSRSSMTTIGPQQGLASSSVPQGALLFDKQV